MRLRGRSGNDSKRASCGKDGPAGEEFQRREWVGEDGPGRDPLELLDDVLGFLVALLRELILGLAAQEMSPEQEVAGAERITLSLEDLGDPVAERIELGCLGFEDRLGRAVDALEADRDRPGYGRAGSS